jgi:GH15 family glucan-1,4-alpha-glucosidase
VLWALWEHYRQFRDVDFIATIYRPLIKNCANFLMNYRDPDTGLPLESYDLWEERQSVTTFTTSAVYGGLIAAANFVDAFGEHELAEDYRAGAAAIREAALSRLFSREMGCFARAAGFMPGGANPILDWSADASVCGIFAFGMLSADDPKVASTMKHLRERLWCNTAVGGMARYENDPYYRVSSQTPGNPWFVTTLLLAQYLIAGAKSAPDLDAALELLKWTADHALPSGVLPEQIDPQTGRPLSVSPLTWSHAAFVTTVRQYQQKMAMLANQLHT